jgi:hypothetical protein
VRRPELPDVRTPNARRKTHFAEWSRVGYFFVFVDLCPAARISIARHQVMGRVSAAFAAFQIAFFSA